MKKRVLFLCTGNSARSQMAEGFLRHLAGDRFEIESAGTHPVGKGRVSARLGWEDENNGVNPLAIEVMKELDIDIAAHRSKHVDEFRARRFQHVITVCDRAKENCPIFPAASSILHWSFTDPAEAAGSPDQKRAVFRKIRDDIASRVREFLAEEAQE